ncbi:MAG: four-helix bundle copper-binding protein [Methylotenera sp.]|jgi:Cys-rich four helix bundle protein (predicted Tat secretion target)|nr:four-helix bundle copper-binding protein [Methylotenera sp.]
MNRREVLLRGVALAGAAFVGRAQATEMKMDHTHHHDMAAMSANAGLVSAAADCIQKGQVCLNHCLFLLGQGDKDMAACAKSVNQMLALCGALQQLANQESTYLPKLASLAMDACKKCEDECKKHAKKHEACKACGESCAACAKECKKIAA